MVNLSKNLSKIVSKQLGLNLKEEFSEDELSKINVLELMQEDIVYLDYFKNVSELIFSQFPSITEDNIKEVASKIQNLEILRIREQSALKDIDLSNFKNLKVLELAYNDNLVSIRGVSSLNNFILYDNKEYIDTQQIVDIIDKTKNGDLKLDIVYYPMILRYLVDNNRDKGILKKISWVEAVGLRKHIVHEYKENEVNDLIWEVEFPNGLTSFNQKILEDVNNKNELVKESTRVDDIAALRELRAELSYYKTLIDIPDEVKTYIKK